MKYAGYGINGNAKPEGQCRSCKWWEWTEGEHVCSNDESDNFADWTEWNDGCDEWEGR